MDTKNAVTLEELVEFFNGKSGTHDDGETVIIDANSNETISVYTNRYDLTKIYRRCGSKIVSWKGSESGGVRLEIDRSAFRSAAYAFKVVDKATDTKTD